MRGVRTGHVPSGLRERALVFFHFIFRLCARAWELYANDRTENAGGVCGRQEFCRGGVGVHNRGNGMKVLIFGATGMVGQGVLRECLQAADVERVVTVGRTGTGVQDAKLREIVHRDLFHYAEIEGELSGFDACFFTLGVSSSGMTEVAYDHVTFTLTMTAAQTLSRLNPAMTFIYVSGAGTDSTESGRVMWARVKGRTENELLRLPFKAYMFRPGMIQPLDGIRSKTTLYRVMYVLMTPLMTPLRRMFPKYVLSTREIGQAMLAVARHGYGKRILETWDLRGVVGG